MHVTCHMRVRLTVSTAPTPFYVIWRVHLTKFSPFQQSCLEKEIYVTMGVHLHPVNPVARPMSGSLVYSVWPIEALT